MEICKVPTLLLKLLNKHLKHLMYIKIKTVNVIHNLTQG